MADPNLNVNITGTDNLTGELKRVESGVIRFVGAVSAAMSAIGVIGFPILEAVKFQTAILDTARVTKYTADQIAILKEGLRTLSTQVNVSAVDLAKIATLGGQAGIGAADPAALVAFSKTVSSAVSSMGLPAEEVVSSFSKLINIFNIPASKFDNALSALTAVGNASAITAEQLFDVVKRVGDLGGSVNFSGALALAASMVDLGMSSEVAGTSLTKIFADFKAKAPEFAKNMERFGIASTQQWIDLVQTDGTAALFKYADLLNSMGVEEASAMKANLTGQGRLFEAISKVQNQRKRELAIIATLKQAEEQLALIKAKVGDKPDTNGERELKAIQDRVDALKEAAVQSNIIARLGKTAADAWAAGDAAAKAQATILSGAGAQWTLLANSVNAAMVRMGEVALPALTDMLAGMRTALNDPINSYGLKKASEDILGTLQVIGSGIAALSAAITGSGGFDWGALLHFTALAVAIATIKGLMALMRALGGSALLASPGLTALAGKLFGVSEAARIAAAKVAEAAALNARVGGLFNATGGSSTLGNAVIEKQRIEQAQANLNARVAQYTALNAAASAALQAQFAQAFPKYQTVAALEQRILTVTQNITAARALGTAAGNKSAGAYSSQLTKLEAQLNAVNAAQERINRSQAILGRLGTRQAALLQVEANTLAPNPFPNAGAMTARARAVGSAMGAALSAGYTATVTAGMAATSAFISGAAAGTTAATRFGLGVKAAANQITTSIYVSTVTAGSAITRFVGRAILDLTGYTAAWAAASGATVKAALATEIAVTLLSKAVKGLMTLAMRLVSFVFIATMLIDVLKMVGVWDTLSAVIQKVFDLLGLPMPEFLKSDADAKALAKSVAEVERKMAGSREEAAKFTSEMQTLLAQSREISLIKGNLAFNVEVPTQAMEKLKKDIEATAVGLAVQANNIETLKLAEQERYELQKKISELKLRESTGGLAAGIFAGGAWAYLQNQLGITAKKIKEAEAELAALDARTATLKKLEKDVGDVGQSFNNLATLTLSAAEAQFLLTRNQDTGISRFQAILQARVKELDILSKIQVLSNEKPDTSATGNAAASEVRKRKIELEALSVEARDAKKEINDLQKEIDKGISAGTPGATWLSVFMESVSPQAIRGAISRMTSLKDANVQFQDIMKTTAEAGGVAEIVVQRHAMEAKRGMYAEWGKMAQTAADATKNAVEESLRTVATLAKGTEAALAKVTQSAADNAQKASNNAADKGLDAATAERVALTRQEYAEKLRIIEAAHARTAQYETETAYTRARNSKQVRDNAAAEKIAIDAITESADSGKSRRDFEQKSESTSKLIDETFKYGEVIKQVNKDLEKPDLTAAQKFALLEKGKDAYEKMTASGKLAQDQLNALANTPPVGSKAIINETDLSRIRIAIGSVGEAMKTGTTDVNAKLHSTLSNIAQGFTNVAEEAARKVKALDAQLKLSTASMGADGPAMIAVVEAQLKATGALVTMITTIKDSTRKGLLNPEDIGQLDPTAYLEKWKAEMADLPSMATRALKLADKSETKIPITTTFDPKAVTDGLAALKTGDNTVVISPSLGAGAQGQLQAALTSMTGLTVKVYAELYGPGAKAGARTPARGGLAQDPNPLYNFASGGRVTGPGSSTSDSIFAMLSNGEYVMDALTTAAFGSKFFSSLQSIARGGASGNFLRKLSMPTFAAGGPVSRSLPTSIMGASAASSAATLSDRGTVDINLNVGGSKVSLFGERQQADRLVQVLKRMEVSA